MATIGLIAAMSQESNAFLRYIKGWTRTALGAFECKSFEIQELHCMLVTSGMGVRRASEATREIIKVGAPRLIISFGIAGAVEAELEIGDVVVPEVYCKLVNGVTGPLMPLEPWNEAAREAATRTLAGRGAHLFAGTAVTTGGSQVGDGQFGEMKHPILEMETAGIAQVAAESGIPLLSIRAISDGPRAPIPFDLGEIIDEDANLRLGRALMVIVRHPKTILQLGGMMRNTKIAADNAAAALFHALGSEDVW